MADEYKDYLDKAFKGNPLRTERYIAEGATLSRRGVNRLGKAITGAVETKKGIQRDAADARYDLELPTREMAYSGAQMAHANKFKEDAAEHLSKLGYHKQNEVGDRQTWMKSHGNGHTSLVHMHHEERRGEHAIRGRYVNTKGTSGNFDYSPSITSTYTKYIGSAESEADEKNRRAKALSAVTRHDEDTASDRSW